MVVNIETIKKQEGFWDKLRLEQFGRQKETNKS